MTVPDYLKTNTAVLLISQSEEVGASREILKAVAVRRDRERKQVEDHPERNDKDLRRDVIYRMGFTSALNWVLQLPEEARKIIPAQSEDGGI